MGCSFSSVSQETFYSFSTKSRSSPSLRFVFEVESDSNYSKDKPISNESISWTLSESGKTNIFVRNLESFGLVFVVLVDLNNIHLFEQEFSLCHAPLAIIFLQLYRSIGLQQLVERNLEFRAITSEYFNLKNLYNTLLETRSRWDCAMSDTICACNNRNNFCLNLWANSKLLIDLFPYTPFSRRFL